MSDPFSGRRHRILAFTGCCFIVILAFSNHYLQPRGWALLQRQPLSVAWQAATASPPGSHKLLSEKPTLLEESAVETLEMQVQSLQDEINRLKMSQFGATTPRHEDKYMGVKYQNEANRKRILVTGGAGFVGSHLVDHLMLAGHEVIALDNYFTGRKRNVEQWIGHPNFELVHHDVVNSYFTEVDEIYHLASPASPPHYMQNPVKTIKTNTIGTINMLGLARRLKVPILLASTSEVYGDPEVHPQPETYWGRVNTVGPRSCYDEGKRVAESLMAAYHAQEKVDIRIARIFNTFGPRMHMDDGRVVSNFILQALRGDPITIYGDGKQTRSFQYVDDLVSGLIKLMESNFTDPVNIGNPEERTINEFAELIRDLVGSTSTIIHKDGQQDDPRQRKPDITRAAEKLNWKPEISMRDGLLKTIDYFRQEMEYERMMLKEDYEKEKEADQKAKTLFAARGVL